MKDKPDGNPWVQHEYILSETPTFSLPEYLLTDLGQLTSIQLEAEKLDQSP